MVLAGCGGMLDGVNPNAQSLPRQITVSNGLVIDAPRGYCARPELTKSQSSLVFAAFSPCQDTGKTVLTVALRRMSAVSVGALPDPETPTDQVITRLSDSQMKLVQLKNSDLHLMQPVDQTFWRMVAYDQGYLVLANLYSAPGKTVSQTTAQQVFGGLSWGIADTGQRAAYLPMTQPWPRPKYRP